MPYITKKGCCGSSLQRTCLVIGIVFVVLEIISTFLEFFTVSSFNTYGIPSILLLVASVCLIFAATLENKYLCIPWFIGFGIAIIMFIIALIGLIYYLTYSSDSDSDSERVQIINAIGFFINNIIFFVVELVLLRYVLSYYKELD